jgi:CheY-like chemotaxis protein
LPLVLLIEDSRTNVALVNAVLGKRPNIRLIVANDGRSGLDLARQDQPNLVLLDMHLPDMAGEDVLEALKRGDRTRHAPVVVLTADARPERSRRLLAAGAHGYLTKPLDVGELLELVDRITGGVAGG